MNPLAKFEDFVERLVESATFRLMKGRLQPVEIAKRLARAMEQGQVVGPGGRMAPNSYQIELNPKDLELFAACRAGLERELTLFLQQTASEQGVRLMAHPAVSLVDNAAVSEHEIRVRAVFSESGSIPTAVQEVSLSQTARFSVEVLKRGTISRARLVDSKDQPIDIHHTPFRIGRGLDNDLIVDDARVSRRHAQITRQGERWFLSDLDSMNGTQVNGTPVRRTSLHDGDRLSLGGVEYTFTCTKYDAI